MPDRPVLTIAFAGPLTGPQASPRSTLPFDLRFRREDDRAKPAEAEIVARRLVADSTVVGVVGHKNSGASAAAAPVYHAAGLAQLTPCSTNAALSQQGYRTFFRLCAHDGLQG